MKSKVFLGSLYLIFVLLFTSCNVVSIGNNGGQLIFTLGEDVVNVISSRQATGDVTEELEYSVKVSLTGDYSATVEKTAPLSTLATIPFEFEGIPIGARIRASCSVSYDGINWWSGSSDEIIVDASSNRSVITLTKHFGVVVWTEYGGSITLKVASTLDDVENANQIDHFDESPIFTFGNEGELYYLNVDRQLQVRKRDTEGLYGIASNIYSDGITKNLTQDRKTGKLYGMKDSTIVSIEDACQYDVSIFTEFQGDLKGIVVENDVFYLYSDVVNISTTVSGETTSSNTYQVTVGKYKIDFASTIDDGSSASTASQLAKKTITFPIERAESDPSPMVNDAIIQDGALYLLLRNVVTSDSSAFYSRGGLIKINLSTLELVTSFGTGGILGWTSSESPEFNNDNVSFYGPADDTSSNFIGPVKFVGIMPKKLFIAEHGVHISKNAEGNPVGKIKSRVLVVDLETATASVEWNKDYTSKPESSEYVYYQTADVSFPSF